MRIPFIRHAIQAIRSRLTPVNSGLLAIGHRKSMEITNSNFEETLPAVKQAIKDSIFLAIDGEFTGLNQIHLKFHLFATKKIVKVTVKIFDDILTSNENRLQD